MKEPEIRGLSDHKAGDLAGYYPGQAPGAIANGARIVKTRSETGDSTPVGTHGLVLASHVAPIIDPLPAGVPVQPVYLYFVIWDNKPGVPAGISDYKITAL